MDIRPEAHCCLCDVRNYTADLDEDGLCLICANMFPAPDADLIAARTYAALGYDRKALLDAAYTLANHAAATPEDRARAREIRNGLWGDHTSDLTPATRSWLERIGNAACIVAMIVCVGIVGHMMLQVALATPVIANVEGF